MEREQEQVVHYQIGVQSIALRLQYPPTGEHSQTRSNGRVWRSLWALNILPKVWNFLWKACTNILPTRANLQKRKVTVDPHCTICRHHEETVSHILWECPLARNVWALVRGKLQKCQVHAAEFFLLVRALMDMLTRKDMEQWAITSLAIWNARNKYYSEEQPEAILRGASYLLGES